MNQAKEKGPRTDIRRAKRIKQGKPTPRAEICQPFFILSKKESPGCNLNDPNLSAKGKDFMKALLSKESPLRLKAGDFLTTSDLADRFQVNRKTIHKRLHELTALGYAAGAQAGKETVWIFSNVRRFAPTKSLDRTLLKVTITSQKRLRLRPTFSAITSQKSSPSNTIDRETERHPPYGGTESPCNIIPFPFNQKGRNQMNQPDQLNLLSVEEKPKPPKERKPNPAWELAMFIHEQFRKNRIVRTHPKQMSRGRMMGPIGLIRKRWKECPIPGITLEDLIAWSLEQPELAHYADWHSLANQFPNWVQAYDQKVLAPRRKAQEERKAEIERKRKGDEIFRERMEEIKRQNRERKENG